MQKTYVRFLSSSYFLTLFCLFFTHTLPAQIIECKRIIEILKYIKPDTLIIFDLDNTVFEPTTPEGSDQWFTAHVQQKISQGHTYYEALDHVLPRYYELQNQITMQLVEEETHILINFLQDNGYHVIALTARARIRPLINRTLEFLHHLNIDFSKTAFSVPHHTFNTPHPLWYENGIIFSGNNDKGTALKEVLTCAHYTPRHIVCVDDKRKYLEDVQTMAHHENLEFYGLRYGYLDAKVSQFRLN